LFQFVFACVRSEENHPINKNINLVKLGFASDGYFEKNGIKKPFIKGSPQSKAVGHHLCGLISLWIK
jgi:hypothetical protein